MRIEKINGKEEEGESGYVRSGRRNERKRRNGKEKGVEEVRT